MNNARFTALDLMKMLKNLGALSITPEGRHLLVGEMEQSIRRSKLGGMLLEKIRLMYDLTFTKVMSHNILNL